MPAANATAIQDAKDDLERLVNRRNAIEERLTRSRPAVKSMLALSKKSWPKR